MHVDGSFLHCIISVSPYGTAVSGGTELQQICFIECTLSSSLNVNKPLLYETIYYLKTAKKSHLKAGVRVTT